MLRNVRLSVCVSVEVYVRRCELLLLSSVCLQVNRRVSAFMAIIVVDCVRVCVCVCVCVCVACVRVCMRECSSNFGVSMESPRMSENERELSYVCLYVCRSPGELAPPSLNEFSHWLVSPGGVA